MVQTTAAAARAAAKAKKATSRRGKPVKAAASNGAVQPGELVQGVRLELVHPGQLAASLKALGLPTTGGVREQTERLAQHFLATPPSDGGDEYDQCEKCMGHQDMARTAPLLGEVCVFCGDGPGKAVTATGDEVPSAAPPPLQMPALPDIEPPAIPAPLTEGTEADLEAACKQIEKLVTQGVKTLWQIGREVAQIHERRLWQYRLGPDNAPLYTSFEGFMRGEMKMSDDQAYRYIRTYRAFTEDDVKLIGHSKLDVILRLPPGPMREKLKAQAEAGASRRQLSKEADALQGKPEKAEPAKVSKVTLMAALETVRLPMTKRGKGKKADAKPEPAMSVKDDAECVEVFPNGVERHYRLSQTRSGQLRLTIETRRVAE